MKNTIYGIHSIMEALRSQQEIDKIFVQKNLESDALSTIVELAEAQHIAVSHVPVQKLDKLANGIHQGAVAKISPVELSALQDMVGSAFERSETPLFILCDGISDVRNFGAIVRTAECSGADGIIIPKQGSAAINDQTVKTSAGAVFNIPICKSDHLKDAIFFLQSYGIQFVAANEHSPKSVYEVDFKKPTALIMGSEGKGVSKALLKMSTVQAKLPLLGKTESLNVSVACGIFLYEAVRQKRGA